MLFYTYDDICKSGDTNLSEFVEFQYCECMSDDLGTIFGTNKFTFRHSDSLYFHWDDNAEFFSNYGEIFTCGIYPNLQNGTVDICGVNYYKPDTVNVLLAQLRQKKPAEYETVISWLEKAGDHNGFYILGI